MASIFDLSNELLKDILDHIELGSKFIVPIDRREHLSVESFRPPVAPPRSQAQDIASLRLSCRRFAEIGISYQFSRLSLRFSPTGFARLDAICDHGHLTRHVKKFSYMVPPFYINSLSNHSVREHDAIIHHLERKIAEQRRLLRTAEDVRVLRKAMKAFTVLQHVQLLRLIEPVEFNLTRHSVTLEWPRACSHATKTLGEALIGASSPFCRFSGPMMEPQTARIIQERMLALLASRLTCLELHFDGGLDLVDRMTDLSALARSVLQAAKNLQAIHVGFPSRTPLDLRLETVFHNIQWRNLRAFGIQAWRLDADEIISIARRHKSTLRGLRLRDVQLKDGNRWADILLVLRQELRQLEWVSLRRIDYSEHFDQENENSIEVLDDTTGGASSESDGSSTTSSEDEQEWPSDLSDRDSIVNVDVEDSDEESLADTDHGPEADDIAISPDTPITLPFCTCDTNDDDYKIGSPEVVGDNGIAVTYQQRKMWERWVVGRCPEHTC